MSLFHPILEHLVAPALLRKVNGVDQLKTAFNDTVSEARVLLSHRRIDGDAPEVLDQEIKDIIEVVLEHALFAMHVGYIGYVICRDEYPSVMGMFFATQPSFTCGLVVDLIKSEMMQDGREHRLDLLYLTEVYRWAGIAAVYLVTGTILSVCIPVLRFTFVLAFDEHSTRDTLLGWGSVFAAMVLLNIAPPRAGIFLEVFHKFRKFDRSISSARDYLCGLTAWAFVAVIRWAMRMIGDFQRSEQLQNIAEHREFEHSPLEAGSIRLLRVGKLCLRDLFFNNIDCELIHVPLSEAPAHGYECISYRWDNSEHLHYLNLGNALFWVSPTVKMILLDHRSFFKSKYVWIDQVCINQRNSTEKSEQVRMMKDIYEKASKVIIHLGAGGQLSHLVRTQILIISFLADGVKSNWSGTVLDGWYQIRLNEPLWRAVAGFLRHEWFGRVWIVQETVVASSLTFFYGGLYIPYRAVDSAVRSLDRTSLAMMQDSVAINNAKSFVHMSSLRRQYQKDKQLPLAKVLSTFRTSAAEDPRDKVYGLIGLTNAILDGLFEVDYSKDKVSVVRETVRCLIDNGEYFQTVHAAGIGRGDADPAVPSWIPNWTLTPNGPLPLTQADPFQCTFSSSGTHEPTISVGADYSECTFTGQQIDKILQFTLPLQLEGNEKSIDEDHVRLWVADCKELVTQIPPGEEQQALNEAFWRTLIADKDDDEEFAGANFEQNFHRYMAKLGHAEWPAAFSPRSQSSKTAYDDIGWVQGIGKYKKAMSRACIERRFAITQTGRIGLVPAHTKRGDVVCILFGAQTPLVLRPESRQGNEVTITAPFSQSDCAGAPRYQLVGECYIHGVMRGEMSETLDEGSSIRLY